MVVQHLSTRYRSFASADTLLISKQEPITRTSITNNLVCTYLRSIIGIIVEYIFHNRTVITFAGSFVVFDFDENADRSTTTTNRVT